MIIPVSKPLTKAEQRYSKSKIEWCNATTILHGHILLCCTSNHPGFKHYNPRILKTCGGEMYKIPGWSCYTHDRLEGGKV